MKNARKFLTGIGFSASVTAILGIVGYATIFSGYPPREAVKLLATPSRAAISDRNGVEMVKPQWLYSIAANGARDRSDAARAAGLIQQIVGSFRVTGLQERLTSKASFAWVIRGIDKASADKILALGLKGFEVRLESGRAYPDPMLAPHVLGALDIDGRGIAGLERGIERELQGRSEPWISSLDVRLQLQANAHLDRALAQSRASAGATLVLDVRTGEILTLSSAPRFRSGQPLDALEKGNMNRAAVGVDEARSISHLIVAATLVESGYRRETRFPVIDGYGWHGVFRRAGRAESLQNLAVTLEGPSLAHAALGLGPEALTGKIKKLGLLDAIQLETRESSPPLLANRGNLGPRHLAPPASAGDHGDGDSTEAAKVEIDADPEVPSPFPAASGEGIAASPLAWSAAVAGIINCGRRVFPTFRKQAPNATAAPDGIVFSEATARIMREILRGEARNLAQLKGLEALDPGAMTGFDEKVVNGRYVANRIRSNAAIAFPMHAPRYLIYAMLDEPTMEKGGGHVPDRSAALRIAAALARDLAAIFPVDDSDRVPACHD